MSITKVIMIEDDIELAEVLTQYLWQHHIQVTNFEEPFLAMSELNIYKYDLMILDLSLPGMDGLEVCKAIKSRHKIPIIVSSARSDISDKVAAFELGADDYLPKPYDPKELQMRIQTIVKRYSLEQVSQDNKHKKFVYDKTKKEIRKDDHYIKLTVAEYEVLALLIQAQGVVVSKEDIIDNISALHSDESSGSLAVIINRIRHKIEQDPKHPHYLQTIRGMGYKFVQ